MNPTDIIALFDFCITETWGSQLARPWPHNGDKLTADEWISMAAGKFSDADLLGLLKRLFLTGFERRKAKNQSIPFSLSYFKNQVRDGITTYQAPVEDDPETLQWKARVRGWMTNPRLWMESSWGSPPDQPHTRCPRHVRSAMGLECGARR